MHKTLIAVLLFASSTGCHRRPAVEAMPAGWCDTVPPPVRADARRPVRIPDIISRSDQATVVGSVIEAGTGRPLESAIAVQPDTMSDSLPRVAQTVYTDSFGGFALRAVVPGSYTLHFRSVSHRTADQRLLLRPGATDTVRIELRFFTCVGF